MYQNYIFDFYGTLVDIKTDEKSKEVWNKIALFMGYQGTSYSGKKLSTTYDMYVNKYLSRVKGTNYPEIELVDVFYKLYKDGGVKASPKVVQMTVKAFRAISTDYIQTYDGIIDLLEELKKRNNQIYLLCNGQRAFLLPELKMLGLKKYFDKIYVSSDMGMRKPEPKLLEMILEENKLKKRQTIFIGNEYSTDIKLANKLSVDSLYIQTEISHIKSKKEESTYKILDGKHKNILKILS